MIVGNQKNYIFNLEEYIKHKPFVITLNNIDDLSLQVLYKNMEALFFLSRYEGFGLPVLEAAKFNKKIISSKLSSIPEIAPPSALLLDPYKPPEILAEKIWQYLTKDIIIDNKSFLKKFSWKRTVEEIFNVC